MMTKRPAITEREAHDLRIQNTYSLDELMDGMLPLCPIEIATNAKKQLDSARQAIHFSDYLQEHAAIRLLHVIGYLKESQSAKTAAEGMNAVNCLSMWNKIMDEVKA